MKSKTLDRIWAIGLIVLGITTFILAGSSLLGITLPGIAVGIITVIDVITVLVLEIVSVKRAKSREEYK